MTQSWLRPWSYSVSNGAHSSGSVTERIQDTRSPLVKNPRKGRWRNPSNYSRLIERGDVNTFFGSVDAVGVVRITGSGGCNSGGGWYSPVSAVSSWLEDNAVLQALTRLKSSKVNFSVALGERKQTAALVADSCKRLAGMVLHTRRTAFKLATDPFALWLELQYGWKPLLSDVHGAVSELMNHGNPEKVNCTVVGSAQERIYYVRAGLGSNLGTTFIYDQVNRGVNNVKVRLDFTENDNPTLATLAREGLTNPLTLAWELLPFSFVADWFIPIGKYFDCLDATLGWTFKGGTKSVMQRKNYYATNPRMLPGGGYSGTATAEGRANIVKLTRTVYGSSPLPTRPHFNDKSSSLHVANGIALLGAAFTTKLR